MEISLKEKNQLFRIIKCTFVLLVFFSIFFAISIFYLNAFYSFASSPANLSSSSLTSTSSLSTQDLFEPTRLNHLVFGIGGSAKIWKTRQVYTQLWWDANTTRGFVWLDKEPSEPTPGSFPPYKVSNMTAFKLDSNKKPSDSDRMARIVKESFELGLPNVRWFVMGDDDTVFFTENLITVLSKYDHREMYYIGAPSETVEQALLHGYDLAFGGGGFAVSYGLASELVRILDGCVKKYHHLYGSDEKVSACIAELGVPLTKEPGFHQLDIRGDIYGFLAAHPVAPLVSLHHLVGAYPLFPGRTQVDSLKHLMRAYHIDPPLIVQQSFCYDRTHNWSISIAWGYTVQLYPFLVPSKILKTPLQTFRIWTRGKNGSFTFDTQPMKNDSCQRPIIFYLDEAKKVGKSLSESTYKRAIVADGKECKSPPYKEATPLVNIMVSASKTDPDKWIKAPRRECCEIINSKSSKTDMRIVIRRCKPYESITI